MNAKTAPKPAARQPVQTLRLGRIKAAVWENEADQRKFYNVTFTRTYKDGETFKDSESFGRDDLPLVAKLADQAHSFIFAKLAKAKDEPAE